MVDGATSYKLKVPSTSAQRKKRKKVRKAPDAKLLMRANIDSAH